MRFGAEIIPEKYSRKRIKKFAWIPVKCFDNDRNYVWVWFEKYYRQLKCTVSPYGEYYWVDDGNFIC
jgi:hypothetical protein